MRISIFYKSRPSQMSQVSLCSQENICDRRVPLAIGKKCRQIPIPETLWRCFFLFSLLYLRFFDYLLYQNNALIHTRKFYKKLKFYDVKQREDVNVSNCSLNVLLFALLFQNSLSLADHSSLPLNSWYCVDHIRFIFTKIRYNI